MGDNFLFADSHKNRYSCEYILEQMKSIGADDCDILFIHTDILFGHPNPILRRKGYLEALYQVFLNLNVPTLAFPAFSYSFPNQEVFDVNKTRTSMGALNEYIRRQPNVYRSLDPLLSVIATGEHAELLTGKTLEHHSFGTNSVFARLHQIERVKFLFFGADFSQYFTYIHYIEKMKNVPYRFDKSFNGTIVDYDGNMFQHTHTIHTQCGGVKLKDFSKLKSDLLEEGILKKAKLGDGEMCCVSEDDIFRVVVHRLEEDPYTFVEPYTQEDLTNEYVFGKNGERITHC